MASNPRMAQSNVGVNAGQRAKDMLNQRRSTPGAGIPQLPETNNAGMRSRNSLAAGRDARAQGGAGAGPIPAQQNAADRALQAAANRRAQRTQNRGM
jgi:hypothetical protein